MLKKKKCLLVLLSLGIWIFSAFSVAIIEDIDRNPLAGDNGGDVSLLPSVLFLTNAESYWTLNSKKTIIDTYCQAALSDTMVAGKFLFSGDQITFNSKNSLFVRGLCYAWEQRDAATKTSVETTEPLVAPSLIEGVFMSNVVKQLKLEQMKNTEDMCGLPSVEECDIARYASKVYTTLMSDIFKIKWAHFLQVESIKSFNEDKQARVAKVFEVFFATQESNKGDYFLFYPKTTAMIDNNQQFFAKSLQTLVMLDNDSLAEEAIKVDDREIPCSLTLTGEIAGFVCGLHMPNQLGTDPYFINFIVNEYLNYRLFIDFYSSQQKKRLIEDTNLSDGTKAFFVAELNAFSAQRTMYEQALRLALIDFQDFVATYPFHLGFVWYQEQLLKFRDNYITKMVTPFYSLYEKLRNVQPPET